MSNSSIDLTDLRAVIEFVGNSKLKGWFIAKCSNSVQFTVDSTFHLGGVPSKLSEQCRVSSSRSVRSDIALQESELLYDLNIDIDLASCDREELLKSLINGSVTLIGSDLIEYELRLWPPCKVALQVMTMSSNEINAAKHMIQLNRQVSVSDNLTNLFEENLISINNYNIVSSTFQAKECAVVTYAHSNSGWWDYFVSHYSDHLGSANIYVLTPSPHLFESCGLAGIFGLIDRPFDDMLKSTLLSDIANTLRTLYRYVLVCDVDEIILPPRLGQESLLLSDYLSLECPKGVTYSLGLDVIQMDEEPDFDFSLPVYAQRSFAIYNSALSKPHLSAEPVRFSGGHHFCSLPPSTHPTCYKSTLVSYHLKYACKKVRKDLLRSLDLVAYVDPAIDKYSKNSLLDPHPAMLQALSQDPISLRSQELNDFHYNYLSSIKHRDSRGFYTAPFAILPKLVAMES